MPTLTVAEAQSRLSQLIDQLLPGEEVVLTRDYRPVARLVGETPPRKPRRAGNCVGMAVIVADDDDHLKEFAEYME
jgi:antitoxin (DNA-binding transcriptional repressor) of toxin-antitoxin stability system